MGCGKCAVVAFANYVLGGGVKNGTIPKAFPYLAEGYACVPEFFGMEKVIRLFSEIPFDLGAYGVSIFFLISGFVISMSLEHKSIRQFVMKRILRIWPVYVTGFSATFFMIWAYTKWSGTAFPYEIKDWVIQCSLLRDWLWIPCIDGISWTLVAELKFYIVMCVIFYFHKAQCKRSLIGIAAAMLVFNASTCHIMEYLLEYHIRIYYIVYTLVFSNINILYMLLGVCIYNYYKKYWTVEAFTSMLIIIYLMLGLSVAFSYLRDMLQLYTTSYLFGLLTFLAAYVLKDRVAKRKLLNKIGEISYPLYVVHGLNGYIMQTFLVQHQVYPLLCFVAVVTAAVIAADFLHRTVEKFCEQWSGRVIQ